MTSYPAPVLRQQLVVDSNKIYFGENGRTHITIHETANRSRGANAAAHANLQSRGNVRLASWHWQVDDKEAVQSFPHTTRCWHAGDGRGQGNYNSIGIEICVNEDGDYDTALFRAAQLVAHIRQQENISIDKIVPHRYWSGKNCPTILLGGSTGNTWNSFIGLVLELGGVVGTQRLTPRLVEDGVRGPLTIGGWQQIMGTPVDRVISRPRSQLIVADQAYLNNALGPDHMRNLVGEHSLLLDGIEGRKTILARQFLLKNRVDWNVQLTGTLDTITNRAHQRALNAAIIASGEY